MQATIEYGFTLKRVRDMIRTYSELLLLLAGTLIWLLLCKVGLSL